MNKGAVFIAYGDRARREATAAVLTIMLAGWKLPAKIITNQPLAGVDTILDPVNGFGGRNQKTRLLHLSPFDDTLYMDADTRVLAPAQVGFQLLSDGWDMAMTASSRQGDDLLWQVTDDERERTFDAYGTRHLLALQPGVMFIRKNDRTLALFDAWHREWLIEDQQDAAAFMRALAASPVKLALLGRPFNGGPVIQHYFGRARE